MGQPTCRSRFSASRTRRVARPRRRRDRQVVDPASVALIADHTCRNDLASDLAHQEPLGVDLEFPLDVPFRIVLGDHQATGGPKGDNGNPVLRTIGPDYELIVTHYLSVVSRYHKGRSRRCQMMAPAMAEARRMPARTLMSSSGQPRQSLGPLT